jgi:predicted RNA-binding protein YlqC (UPF0109 family)
LKANPDQPITALLEAIAKALVDHSDEVVVWALEGEQVTVLELRVHTSDRRKIIGKGGEVEEAV